MFKRLIFIFQFIIGTAITVLAAPIGWAGFASGGSVYKCAAGESPEKLYTGEVAHARWSVDGRHIFFIKSNGEIWAMNNDGSNPHQVYKGFNTSKCPIAAYGPDPEYLLYVERNKFFKISIHTKNATLIHTDTREYDGEIAINTAGTRMAARAGGNLYKITVGEGSKSYYDKCSASISPDGKYLTGNVSGHEKLLIFNWEGGIHKTLTVSKGNKWDNQRFASNSSDYVVYKFDGTANAVGIIHVPSNSNTSIGNKSSEYPDFFLGDLPPEGKTAVRLIAGSKKPSPAGIRACDIHGRAIWKIRNRGGYMAKGVYFLHSRVFLISNAADR